MDQLKAVTKQAIKRAGIPISDKESAKAYMDRGWEELDRWMKKHAAFDDYLATR